MDERFRSLVRDLSHPNEQTRTLAAAYLGDRLERAAKTDADVNPIAEALVDALSREPSPVVQEEIAHSLAVLVEHGTVPPGIVPPLTERLPELDPEAAEHIAAVLEASSWPRSRPSPSAHFVHMRREEPATSMATSQVDDPP